MTRFVQLLCLPCYRVTCGKKRMCLSRMYVLPAQNRDLAIKELRVLVAQGIARFAEKHDAGGCLAIGCFRVRCSLGGIRESSSEK